MKWCDSQWSLLGIPSFVWHTNTWHWRAAEKRIVYVIRYIEWCWYMFIQASNTKGFIFVQYLPLVLSSTDSANWSCLKDLWERVGTIFTKFYTFSLSYCIGEVSRPFQSLLRACLLTYSETGEAFMCILLFFFQS